MGEPRDEYDPIHHLPDTPVVLAFAASAVFAWLYVRYGQAATRSGVVGLALAAAVVPLFSALRRAPGLRLLVLTAVTIAQVAWYVVVLG